MDALGQMAFGRAMQLGRDNRSLVDQVNEAHAEIHKANGYIRQLNARVAELELALAVAQATEEADDALLAEWKALHPNSPLRQLVGKYKDGRPKTKASTIWDAAFDAAARKRGITNPLAHRIS